MRSQQCVKCGGSMSRGFLLQQNANHAHDTISWVEGEPVKSFWRGLKLGGKAQYSVETWRCSRCGLLESYAR